MAAAADSSPPDEDPADEPAARAGPDADAEDESEEAEGAAGGAVGGKSLEELAVRFSQATKELQAKPLCMSPVPSVHAIAIGQCCKEPCADQWNRTASCAMPHYMHGEIGVDTASC